MTRNQLVGETIVIATILLAACTDQTTGPGSGSGTPSQSFRAYRKPSVSWLRAGTSAHCHHLRRSDRHSSPWGRRSPLTRCCPGTGTFPV